MTVETLQTFTDWQQANGTNKNWTYDFVLFELEDCYLEYKATLDGNITKVTTDREFFPGLAYEGGYIKYPSAAAALASGYIRVVREVPYTQKTAIGLEGSFRPEIHERALDRLTMMAQQLAQLLARSWKAPWGSEGGEINPLEEGHVPVFDAEGNMVDGGDISALTSLLETAEEALEALELVQELIAGLTPFGSQETTVDAGSTDTIDLGNASVVNKNQIILTVGQALWPKSAYNVALGVISPIGVWPGNPGDPDLAISVDYFPMVQTTVGIVEIPDEYVRQVHLSGVLKRAVRVTPTDYNAEDGAVIPSQAALQAWLSACISERREAFVPAGQKFLSNAQLDCSAGSIDIIGGPGSRIDFGNAASGGFKFSPDIALDPEMRFKIDGLRIGARAVISRAIEIILPNDEDFTNETQIDLRNLRIKGVSGSGGYFSTAIRERNVSYNQHRNILYWGSVKNAVADSGYYAGIMFDIDTQAAADDPTQGLTLENLIESCHGHFINTGLRIRNFCEGVMLMNSSFVARRGVDASSPVGTRQPSLRVINNHFAVTEWGIKAERIFKSKYLQNEIYRGVDKEDLAWKGIWLIDAYQSFIGGGSHIFAETNALAAAAAIGIVIEGNDSSASWDCQISETVIGGGSSGSFKAMAAGIQINNTQNNVNVDGGSVHFNGVITEQIDDNSGTLTNGIKTGLTLSEGGVAVSKVGGLTQIDLAAGDFTTAATPAKDVVAVALEP